MKLSSVLLFLQLWVNVEVSLSQNACSMLPNVAHAHVSEETKKAVYQEGDVIHFSCESGYISDQISKFVCTASGWLVVRQGKCYSCSTLPDVPNARVTEETRKAEYREGDVINFACQSGYASDLTIKYVCASEGWQAIRQGACYHGTCKVGVMHPNLYVAGLPPSNEVMTAGHQLRFLCSDKYVVDGSTEIECLENGQWNSPFPTCSVPQGCGRPPPLSDGDTRITPESQYQHNEKVEYICQNYYVMEGGPFKTCINGEWTGNITCLRPCTVNREEMDRHNIRFRYTRDDKLYSEHDDLMEFVCTRGRRVGTLGMRQRCVDGVIQLPTCQ